ncbi:T9SS type A sorting domain-containing protein, partial [Candidatus Omnitrophota bacterium]
KVDDPDTGDILSCVLLENPQWLSVDESGVLSGTPRIEDVGADIPVKVIAADSGGFADTLSTTLNVIHVPKPPEIMTTELLNAMVGIEYADIVEVEYLEIDGSISFELIVRPEWLTIDKNGVLSGIPAPEDARTDIPVSIRVVNESSLADTLNTVITVRENPVLDTYIAFDLGFQNTGFQGGGSVINNPGPGERIGFAVYIINNTVIRGFKIDLAWDGTKASYRTSQSGPEIVDDIYDINGLLDLEFAEETNILLSDGTGSLSSIVGVNEEGHYQVSWAKMGGETVTSPEGLLYLAVFKTASDFSKDDWMKISVVVTVSDDKGYEYPLGGKEFKIGSETAPPSNVIVSDIPDDQGHSLKLTWILSTAEENGLVSWYRIYRSRSNEVNEPRVITEFSTIESLNEWELNHTVLIDSVSAGQTEYTDRGVPLNGENYYYWIQASGPTGESSKVASRGMKTQIEKTLSQFRVNPPFPNPFNLMTSIQYEIPKQSHVNLTIFDVLGREIKILKDEIMNAGFYEEKWNGKNDYGYMVGNGVYLYIFMAENYTANGKVILLK